MSVIQLCQNLLLIKPFYELLWCFTHESLEFMLEICLVRVSDILDKLGILSVAVNEDFVKNLLETAELNIRFRAKAIIFIEKTVNMPA